MKARRLQTPNSGTRLVREDFITTLLQALGALCALCAGTARPLYTIIYGGLVNVYNDVERNPHSFPSKRLLNQKLVLLLVIFIGQWILTCIYGILFSIAAMRYTKTLRSSYLRAVVTQDAEKVSEARAATDLSDNISVIEDALSEKLGTVLQALSTVITSIVIAHIQSWRLAVVLIVIIFLAICLNLGTTLADSKLEGHIQLISREASTLSEECFSSIRTITSCQAQPRIEARYSAVLDRMRKVYFRKAPITAARYSLSYLNLLSGYALAFWYGGKLLHSGEMKSGGSVVIVILCINQATNALRLLLPTYSILAKAKSAHTSLSEVIHTETRLDPFCDDGVMLNAPSCSVVFKDVHFAYPSRAGTKVLHGLDLTFEAGKTTAIIGISGSGKSTLAMLLERFYDPSQGQILVNGVEIQDYNIRSLRTGIRVVQQESVLFNDSVFNNVCVGFTDKQRNELSDNAKRQLVEKVCRSVQAHDFIKELPRGYDADVGFQGSLLSGGQRQRIAIARAIISNPTILVFDEATSALDPISERLVQAAIDKVSKERTTIVIAHKLSTVKEADRIIVLENGRVIEEGTHHSLLHSSSVYKHTWEVQNLHAKDISLKNTCMIESLEEGVAPEELGKENASENASETGPGISEMPAASLLSTAKAVTCCSKTLKYICVICSFAAILAAAVFPAQAVIFGYDVTSFQRSGNDMVHSVNFWSLLFFVTAVAALLGFFTLDIFASIGAALVARTYRQKYLHGFLHLPLSFYDNIIHTPGYLGATLSSDPSQLQAFSVILSSMTVTILNLSSVSIMGLIISWRFALVALCSSVPVIVFAAFLRQRSQSKNSKSITESLMDSCQFAAEVIRNIRTVSAFGMEEMVCDTMALKMNRSRRIFYKNIFSTMPLFAFAHSGSILGSTISFWYSGDLFFDRKITALQIWIVFLGVHAGADTAGEFFSNADSIHKARNAWGRISKVIGSVTPPFPQTLIEPTEKPFSTSITFSDVSFAYHSSPYHNVLQDLSFHIAAGSTIAIVGPSGSGKSTIISLLERFYSPTEGSIEIGGRTLSEIDVESYRNHVSLVSQDTQLFDGTVRDNILFGIESGGSEQALIEAARDANIHDFIQSLPNGYNTACGKKGMAFSGGQRQRLAIARALVRNPSILLLDEATSALDSENEIEIKKAMRKVTTGRAAEGRTTVVVTHRLSTVQDADCIFVLVKGSMVEKGTHVELIERKGVYWSMCEKQDLQ